MYTFALSDILYSYMTECIFCTSIFNASWLEKNFADFLLSQTIFSHYFHIFPAMALGM